MEPSRSISKLTPLPGFIGSRSEELSNTSSPFTRLIRTGLLVIPRAANRTALHRKNYLRRFAAACLISLFLSQLSWGIGADNALGPTGEYNGSITTAGSYDPYTGNAKRFVNDLTVTRRSRRVSAEMDADLEHPKPKSMVARLPMGPDGGTVRILSLLRPSL